MHLKKTTYVLLAATLALGFAACKKKGPAEKAGEKLDSAA